MLVLSVLHLGRSGSLPWDEEPTRGFLYKRETEQKSLSLASEPVTGALGREWREIQEKEEENEGSCKSNWRQFSILVFWAWYCYKSRLSPLSASPDEMDTIIPVLQMREQMNGKGKLRAKGHLAEKRSWFEPRSLTTRPGIYSSTILGCSLRGSPRPMNGGHFHQWSGTLWSNMVATSHLWLLKSKLINIKNLVLQLH